MQKKASPCSCVAAYWRKPPIRLPRCLSPVGWMPEKTRIEVIISTYTQRVAAVGSPELLIVMGAQASAEQVDEVVARLEEAGASAHVSHGRDATVIGAIGERELLATLPLEGFPGVEQVLPILKPYKLVSRELRRDPTVIEARGRRIGDHYFGFIAGPCTVETREQTLETARVVHAEGVTMLRGGAFKPRTSPYAFQGLGVEALHILAEAREETGLPLVTELMDPRDVEAVVEIADVIQIGARNMQNFNLLSEVGRAPKPVLLKRGPCVLDRGAADGGRVRGQGGEHAGDPLRARDQDVRAGDAVHARPLRDPGAEARDAPARDRRPLARGRQARPRAAARSGGRRGGRGRDHRRGAPAARGGALRRAAADPAGEFADFAHEIRALASLLGKTIG